jgi:hypothetical protein
MKRIYKTPKCFLTKVPADALALAFSFLDLQSHVRLARASKDCLAVSGLPGSGWNGEGGLPGSRLWAVAWDKPVPLSKRMPESFLLGVRPLFLTGSLVVQVDNVPSRLRLSSMARNGHVRVGRLVIQPAGVVSLRPILRQATQLQHLTRLDVMPTDALDAADLELISKLQHVTTLSLAGCRNVKAAGLNHISQMQQLTTLRLYNCKNVNTAGLEHVSRMQQLTTLNLSCCSGVGDAGLEHISRMHQLKTLDLTLCQDEMVVAGAERISRLNQLS